MDFTQAIAQAGEELSLAHCEVKDLSYVCEMLETPELALTSLDLSANSFGDDEGALAGGSHGGSPVDEIKWRISGHLRTPIRVDIYRNMSQCMENIYICFMDIC